MLGDLERALVGDLEPAHLLDGVAPELDADRVLLGRREDVDDAAAHGELAALLHQLHPGVREVDQPAHDVVGVDLLALHERDRLEVAEPAHLRLQQRPDGCDDDLDGAGGGVVRGRVGQPPQDGDAAADGVGPGREPLVRQRLPRREQRDAVAVHHAAQRGHEVLGLAASGGDGEDRPAGAGREPGDDEGAQAGGRGEVEPVRALLRPVEGAGEGGVGSDDVQQAVQRAGGARGGRSGSGGDRAALQGRRGVPARRRTGGRSQGTSGACIGAVSPDGVTGNSSGGLRSAPGSVQT